MPSINELNLNHTYVTSILEYNPLTGIFYWKVRTSIRIKIGDIAGSPNDQGYIRLYIQSKAFKAHRIAWFYIHGTWPIDKIDHEDGNPSNNILTNLRECSLSENQCNTVISKRNSSGVKGVSWRSDRQKWRAELQYEKKVVLNSYHDNFDDAVKARKCAEQIYHGNFARK